MMTEAVGIILIITCFSLAIVFGLDVVRAWLDRK